MTGWFGTSLSYAERMEVRALHGSDAELAVTRELKRLRDRHDLAGLEWTCVVVVDGSPGIVPHSHPVLTLSTRRQGWLLLATYLHEQLHWWLSQPILHERVGAASVELKDRWPKVPTASDGGARDVASTRLHLIVCSLEVRAMEAVAGGAVAQTLLETRVSGKVYPWVYRQAQAQQVWLATLCDRLDLPVIAAVFIGYFVIGGNEPS